VRLNEKLKVLRELEGRCRGLSRALSKAETVKLIREETGEPISMPYLSQLERGTRTHMTNKTRLLLARFFRVHPAFLIDDPEEFREHLTTPIGDGSQTLPAWLRVGAARFRYDPLVSETLERLATHPERRKALRLLHTVLKMPTLMDRLVHALETKRGLEAKKG
jgi:transcriptional regulator with XRE-family HTH domain